MLKKIVTLLGVLAIVAGGVVVTSNLSQTRNEHRDLKNDDEEWTAFFDDSELIVESSKGDSISLGVLDQYDEENETSYEWSPDGTKLVYVQAINQRSHHCGYFELRIFDTVSERVSIVDWDNRFETPRWSPSGKYLAYIYVHPFPAEFIRVVEVKDLPELENGDPAIDCSFPSGEKIHPKNISGNDCTNVREDMADAFSEKRLRVSFDGWNTLNDNFYFTASDSKGPILSCYYQPSTDDIGQYR